MPLRAISTRVASSRCLKVDTLRPVGKAVVGILKDLINGVEAA